MDLSTDSMIIELTGTPEKIDGFMDVIKDYEISEVCRTGITGIESKVVKTKTITYNIGNIVRRTDFRMFHRSLCSLLQSLTRLSLSVSLEPAKAGAKRQRTYLAKSRPL